MPAKKAKKNSSNAMHSQSIPLPGTQLRENGSKSFEHSLKDATSTYVSRERLSCQNSVVDTTWTTKSQTKTCAVRTTVTIRLPVVVVLSFRRRCLSNTHSFHSTHAHNYPDANVTVKGAIVWHVAIRRKLSKAISRECREKGLFCAP